MISIIEEDDLIAFTCNMEITLLEYIRKVKDNVWNSLIH